MTFCQNRDLLLKHEPTLAPLLHKFVCDDILQDQGRVRGAKIAWSGNFENDKFWRVMLAAATCLIFFGFAGGRPLRASVHLWQGQEKTETLFHIFAIQNVLCEL